MFEIVWNVWTAESLRHFVIPETVSAEKRSEPLSEEPSGEGLTTGVYGYECSGMDEYECTGTLVVFFKFATTCWLFSLVRDRRSTRYSHLCTARNWKNYCVTRILDSRWSLLGWLTNFQLVSPKVTNWPNWPNLIFAIDQWFSHWSVGQSLLPS